MCGEKGHYHIKCPKKGKIKKLKQLKQKKKCRGSHQGGALKIKGEEDKLFLYIYLNANLNFFKHIRNNYVYLSMQNVGFKYHDKSRVNMNDNSSKQVHDRSIAPKGKMVKNLGGKSKKDIHMPMHRKVQWRLDNSRTKKL